MGEYWVPVNLTKKQFVHPHRMGCGLKLGEWRWPDSAVERGMRALIEAGDWSADDIIVAVSDYGSFAPIQAPLTFKLDRPADDVYNDCGSGEGDSIADVSRRACELIGQEYEP